MFAVVTNDWDRGGQALLEWHRGKAGTVEHTHLVLKDGLAAGVYPSGKFGANAAWLRLQVLTNNLLVLMKAMALDAEYRDARPKRLRFAIFNSSCTGGWFPFPVHQEKGHSPSSCHSINPTPHRWG